MKSISPLNKLMKTLGLLFCGLALGTAVQGQILLTVNVADPANVVITATGAAPSADEAILTTYDGITLIDFLHTTPSIGSRDLSGNLQANGVATAYARMAIFSYASGNYDTGFDLNFYVSGGGEIQNFVTGASAFSGSAVVDLSDLAGALPAAGASGVIRPGDGVETGDVIGTYLVISSIPEPSSSAILLGLAGAGFAVVQRRRISR